MAEKKPRSGRAAARRQAEPIATEEGVAGDAQRVDSAAVLARASVPNLLPARTLDERQAAIGARRKRGGPTLGSRARQGTEADAPPVAPTNCAEPPA